MKRYFFTLALLSSVFITAQAQRIYFEPEISKTLFKNFDLTISPQVRFREGFELKQYLFDAGVEYKLSKFFAVGTSYRLGTNITNDGDKENFGRFSVDAKAKIKLSQFEPKFRLRYSNENDDFSDDSGATANFLRYKIELEYSFSGSGFNPYVYSEYFQHIADSGESGLRFEGGLNYKIAKRNTIGAYYRVNSSGSSCFEVVGLSYKLKL